MHIYINLFLFLKAIPFSVRSNTFQQYLINIILTSSRKWQNDKRESSKKPTNQISCSLGLEGQPGKEKENWIQNIKNWSRIEFSSKPCHY